MIIIGILLIIVAVGVVKFLNAKKIRPEFLAYLLVIGVGFYGVAALFGRLPLLFTVNVLEALTTGLVGLMCFGVTYWGLGIFKKLQEAL